MELGDPGLGHAEHLADLAEGQLLVVIERDDELLALRLYAVDVSYSYDVDGMPFRGNRVTVSHDLYEKDFAFELVRKYDVGTTHQVFYNPDSPDASVLETGAPEGFARGIDYVFGVGLPIALILISLIGFWSLAINAI